MLKNNMIRIILLSIVLFIISFIIIIIKGNSYKIELPIKNDNDNYNINIEQTKEIIKYTTKKIKEHRLIVILKSVNKGTAFIEINDDTQNTVFNDRFYVHSFGIITKNEFFGKSSGDIVVPISLIIIIISIIITIRKKYKQSINESLYQYKNIAYLGIIIFLIPILINQIYRITNYNGIITTIYDIIGLETTFSLVLLPIAFIVSILVTISNINLLRKEGFSWKNMLGIFLGIFLCLSSIFPEIMYKFTYSETLIKIHNMGTIDYYIYNFAECLIYTVVAYLECILLGTIILSIKAAKHIPKYDKDYMIILGCKIKKDGSLTPILKSRVDKALEFRNNQLVNTNKDLIFIPSGGKGNDEIISEGEAMKKYLVKEGIKEKNIIVEDKSKNTYENIIFSSKLIKEKNANIAFSTTNYHVFRSGLIAKEQGLIAEGIGSKTKLYFWINAFIREFIGTIYSEKKKHIGIFIIIILIIISMYSLIYVSNNY